MYPKTNKSDQLTFNHWNLIQNLIFSIQEIKKQVNGQSSSNETVKPKTLVSITIILFIMNLVFWITISTDQKGELLSNWRWLVLSVVSGRNMRRKEINVIGNGWYLPMKDICWWYEHEIGIDIIWWTQKNKNNCWKSALEDIHSRSEQNKLQMKYLDHTWNYWYFQARSKNM